MTTFSTKITRLLAQHNIPYRLLPHSQPVFTIEMAAQQRGVVAEEMVKSILLRDRRPHYVMACVRGPDWLDPKAVRACLPDEWKRLSFASAEEILAVTGYVQGAVAPVALPPSLPIIFDEAIATCHNVNISSGDPMAGLELTAVHLLRITGAKIAPITKPKVVP